MSNKRVYLAKSNLASGFDVEYVKSNLLRIPGIEIVDFSSGISASDCTCLVIVPESFENSDINIGKGIYMALEDFCEGGDNDLDNVHVFIGKTDSKEKDVESTTPRSVTPYDYYEEDEDDYVNFGTICTDENNEKDLLSIVSKQLAVADNKAWRKVPTHHQPAKEYALPKIPSVAEREVKKSVSNARHGNSTANYASESGKRLLIRRRRR